jgi:thiamine-monophosphate kinase
VTSSSASRSPIRLADWGELRFLEWVRRTFRSQTGPGLTLTIGDDAAHLRLSRSRDLLVTTDALIEDVHFRHTWISPRDLGAKALVSNLSDLAAMGARPVAAFLSLGIPPQTPLTTLKAFFLGLRSAARRWDCPLAGGDLVRAPQWTINLTLLGRPAVKRRVIPRSAARPGQIVYVTGWPGESAAGLDALRRGLSVPRLIARHNRPTPRLAEAAVLARVCPRLAMIDVSDGVASESAHLARESGLRVDLELERLPVSGALRAHASACSLDPADFILNGGEDYELLFVTDTPVERIRRAFAAATLKTRVTPIGSTAKGRGLRILDAAGREVPQPGSRFEHFA